MPFRHVVAVCTLGRSEVLAACLGALLADMTHGVLLVVDNGDEASGRRVQGALGSLTAACRPHLVPVRVVREPRPGLAHARNRSRREARQLAADVLSFVDDDATVCAGWQGQVLAPFAADSTVAMVGGPVTTILPGPAPWWWSDAINRFYSTADTRHLNGPCAASWLVGGNISYRMTPLCRVAFDFGLGWVANSALAVAGEETALNIRLERACWTAWFNPWAGVEHHVPLSRLRLRWLRRRAAMMGRTAALFECAVEGRSRRQVGIRYRRLLLRSAYELIRCGLLARPRRPWRPPQTWPWPQRPCAPAPKGMRGIALTRAGPRVPWRPARGHARPRRRHPTVNE
jgi:hypothetical protein